MDKNKKISFILPCLNEEVAIGFCLEEIREVIRGETLSAEVIVVDNGSSDRSKQIVEEKQINFPELRLVSEKKSGYGFAYLRGISEASGDYLFLADADGTYDFKQVSNFADKIEEGYDLVIGNRFSKKLEKGVMSWSHRLLGNPFLSFLVRLLFKVRVKDVHCGIRMSRRLSLKQITLYTGGMEFASEMIIKAAKAGLKIGELPVSYKKRIGESKLKTISDGWRHLRFILLYSPLALFLIPGLLIFFAGLFLLLYFYFFNPNIFGLQFYLHPLFLFSLMILFGYQLIIFSAFSKIYAINHFGDSSCLVEKLFKHLTIEKAGTIGLVIVIIGIVLYVSIFISWFNSGFNELNRIKESIIGLTLIMFGAQTFFSAFMFSILGIKEK